VHFVDATHVQVHVRVYDAAGTQIWGRRHEPDGLCAFAWNAAVTGPGRPTMRRATVFCVDPVWVTNFALGNNGQQAPPIRAPLVSRRYSDSDGDRWPAVAMPFTVQISGASGADEGSGVLATAAI